MLDPRAITVHGIGFDPRIVLVQGYYDTEIVIEPEIVQSPGGRDEVIEYRVHFKFTDHLGNVTKQTHVLSQGNLFMKLKYEKMLITPLKIKARVTNINDPVKIIAKILNRHYD